MRSFLYFLLLLGTAIAYPLSELKEQSPAQDSGEGIPLVPKADEKVPDKQQDSHEQVSHQHHHHQHEDTDSRESSEENVPKVQAVSDRKQHLAADSSSSEESNESKENLGKPSGDQPAPLGAADTSVKQPTSANDNQRQQEEAPVAPKGKDLSNQDAPKEVKEQTSEQKPSEQQTKSVAPVLDLVEAANKPAAVASDTRADIVPAAKSVEEKAPVEASPLLPIVDQTEHVHDKREDSKVEDPIALPNVKTIDAVPKQDNVLSEVKPAEVKSDQVAVVKPELKVQPEQSASVVSEVQQIPLNVEPAHQQQETLSVQEAQKPSEIVPQPIAVEENVVPSLRKAEANPNPAIESVPQQNIIAAAAGAEKPAVAEENKPEQAVKTLISAAEKPQESEHKEQEQQQTSVVDVVADKVQASEEAQATADVPAGAVVSSSGSEKKAKSDETHQNTVESNVAAEVVQPVQPEVDAPLHVDTPIVKSEILETPAVPAEELAKPAISSVASDSVPATEHKEVSNELNKTHEEKVAEEQPKQDSPSS